MFEAYTIWRSLEIILKIQSYIGSTKLEALCIKHHWLHSWRTLMSWYSFAWPASIAASASNSPLIFFWGTIAPSVSVQVVQMKLTQADPIRTTQSIDHSDSFRSGQLTQFSSIRTNENQSQNFSWLLGKRHSVFPLDLKLIRRKLGAAGSYLHPRVKQT